MEQLPAPAAGGRDWHNEQYAGAVEALRGAIRQGLPTVYGARNRPSVMAAGLSGMP